MSIYRSTPLPTPSPTSNLQPPSTRQHPPLGAIKARFDVTLAHPLTQNPPQSQHVCPYPYLLLPHCPLLAHVALRLGGFSLKKGSWSDCKSGAFRGLLIAPPQDHQRHQTIVGFNQESPSLVYQSTIQSWSQVDRRLIGSIDKPSHNPFSICNLSFLCSFYFRSLFAALSTVVCTIPWFWYIFCAILLFPLLWHPRCMNFQGVIPVIPRKQLFQENRSQVCQFLVSTWDR